MHKQVCSRTHPVRSRGTLVICAAMCVVCGCDDPVHERLVVATSWPLAERRRLEADFLAWSDPDQGRHPESPRVQWLILDERTDLSMLAERTAPPDVLLGGTCRTHARLVTLGLLGPDEAEGQGLQMVPDGAHDRAGARFEDPRSAPSALAFAVGRLGHGRWPEGYAELIRLAGGGRRSGESMSATECASVLRKSRRAGEAHRFVRFLAARRGAGTATVADGREANDPRVESLIADLLGATLVDAGDELRTAWAALERMGFPGTALKWMTEPPSWPPVSVGQYLSRDGQSGMSLVDTLAHELVPDPDARAWLVRSWLSPSRVVDDTLLAEISQVAGGRLGREPRFRSWLSAEWTASARQRYRRVARLAGADPLADGAGASPH
jgi:hypothetical protein